MTTIVWLLLGSLIGWAACVATRREGMHDRAFNLIAGAVGAVFGSGMLAPMLNVPVDVNSAVNVASVQMAILGAILVLAAVNLLRPSRRTRRAATADPVAVAGIGLDDDALDDRRAVDSARHEHPTRA